MVAHNIFVMCNY